LQKHQLTHFVELVESIKTGDLGKFNSCLDKSQEIFIRKGIFLLVEKLKPFVYRTLFKKT